MSKGTTNKEKAMIMLGTLTEQHPDDARTIVEGFTFKSRTDKARFNKYVSKARELYTPPTNDDLVKELDDKIKSCSDI